MPEGSYTLVITMEDKVGGQMAEARAGFRIQNNWSAPGPCYTENRNISRSFRVDRQTRKDLKTDKFAEDVFDVFDWASAHKAEVVRYGAILWPWC